MSIHVERLSNGLTVICDPMPQVATVAAGLWVGVGARHEPMQAAGLSHLLEHMLFKGTSTRSAEEINTCIENVGGNLNAYTSREQTAYHVHVLAEDAALGVEVIADLVQNSLLDKTELMREKSVIEQEIQEAFDSPDDLVFDLLQQAAWPNQPLGRPILGTVAELKALQPDHLKRHIAQYYHAHNCVLVAAGNITPAQLVSVAQQYFGTLPAQPEVQPHPQPAASYVGGDQVLARDINQLHLCFGFKGVSYTHPLAAAQTLFAMALGGGASSRLYSKLREELGLAYTVYASPSSLLDDGLLSLYIACEGDSATVVEEKTANLLLDLVQNPRPDEFKRAKALCRAALLMELESSASRAERMAVSHLVHGQPHTVQDTLQRLEKVTLQDMQAYGRLVLSAPLSRAAVGQVGQLRPYGDLQTLFALPQ